MSLRTKWNRFRKALRYAALLNGDATELLSARAGQQSGPNQNWVPKNRHAAEEAFDKRDLIRARSRDITINTAFGAANMLARKNHVLGAALKPNPRAKNKKGDLRTNFNDATEQLWNRSVATLDARGVGDGYTVMEQFYHEVIETGAGLIHVRIQPGSGPVPIQFYGIEVDHLYGSGLNRATGNEIYNGIELSKDTNAPVAFHVQDDRISSGFRTSFLSRRLPADECIYAFIPGRFGELCGRPIASPVLQDIHSLQGYDESETNRAQAASSRLHYIISEHAKARMAGMKQANRADDNSETERLEEIPSLGRQYLLKGEEPRAVDDKAPGPQYGDFVKNKRRGMSAATGFSYEALFRDHTDTHFSASKAVWVDDTCSTKRDRGILARLAFDKMYELWLRSGILYGSFDPRIITASAAFSDPETWWLLSRVEWRGHARGFHDPLKDLQAAALGIAIGVDTRTRVCSEFYGRDFADVVKELSTEEGLIRSAGLQWLVAPSTVLPIAEIGQDDSEDDGQTNPKSQKNGVSRLNGNGLATRITVN